MRLVFVPRRIHRICIRLCHGLTTLLTVVQDIDYQNRKFRRFVRKNIFDIFQLRLIWLIICISFRVFFLFCFVFFVFVCLFVCFLFFFWRGVLFCLFLWNLKYKWCCIQNMCFIRWSNRMMSNKTFTRKIEKHGAHTFSKCPSDCYWRKVFWLVILSPGNEVRQNQWSCAGDV